MKKFEINDMNIKGGKLTYNERTAKTIEQENLPSGLTLYFRDDADKLKKVHNICFRETETITKAVLKRTINKNQASDRNQSIFNNYKYLILCKF